MRKISPAPLLPVLSALLAGTSVVAQDDSRGPLSGAATALFVDGAAGGGPIDGKTFVHRNGFDLGTPQSLPPLATMPDLRAILTQHGAPLGVDIDDFSTGLDDILIDQDGVLDVPIDLWSVWSFSLRGDAVGLTGSRIAREAALGTVGSALFSWVLPGSNLPGPIVGAVERSHSQQELGLGSGAVEVDGVDFPLLFGVDQNLAITGGQLALEPGFAGILPPTKRILFTVSHATRDLVPPGWWGTTTRSGATILQTRTTATSGGWTQPSVFASYAMLGLGVDEDIDALAVDLERQKILFSCVGTTRDQFLYFDLINDGGAPHTVLKPDGTKVSESIGKAQTDDVDAVCTLDPHLGDLGQIPPGGEPFGSTCGAPRHGLLGVPRMSGSAYRRYVNGSTLFDSFLVGWPPATGPTPSLAFCFLTTGDNFDPVLIGGIHIRDAADTLPGDPQHERIVVPPGLTLTSLPVTFRWFTLDWITGVVDEAWPVQVWL